MGELVALDMYSICNRFCSVLAIACTGDWLCHWLSIRKLDFCIFGLVHLIVLSFVISDTILQKSTMLMIT